MPLNTLGFDPEDIRDPVTHQPLGTEPIPTGIEEFDIQEEKPPEEHKKWKDHINQDYYKDLDATEQENFRRQYFEHRVAPQVPEDDQFNARMQFDVYSAQDVIGKQHKQSRFSSAGGSLARSFGKMVASLPKAVGEGAVNLANKFGDDPIWGNPEKITPEQTTSYKAGEAIEKWFDKFTVNPEYQDEFWTSDIPEGAGYMLGFMAGGAAGKIAEIPVLVTTMGLGAAATGVEGVEDYLSTLSDDEKADPEMRESAFNLNAVLGTSEGLPISRILDRIDGVTGGGVKRILKEGFKGGLEELTQEVLQSVGQNAIAAKLLAYDPDRSLLTGTKEAGEVGFTLGAILNTLAAMIGSRKTGRTRGPSEPPGEPALEGELLGPEEPDITLGQIGITGHIPQLAAPDGLQEAADTYRDALEQKALPPPAQDTLAEPTAPEIGQTGITGHITAKVDPETGHELIEGIPLEEDGIKLLSAPQEDRREQISVSPSDERRSGDRRVDAQLREKVADMTPEEQYQAIYVDRMTGLHNRRAFEDLKWRKYLASIDVDSLKWVNDTLSPDSGDQMLSEVGRAIEEAIGDSSVVDGYHISGDEYYVQADTQEEADAILEKANQILADKVITHEGKGITKKGINITWGTSTHKDLADQLMKDEKKTKEAKGERAGRGEMPPGVEFATPEAQTAYEESLKKEEPAAEEPVLEETALTEEEKAKDEEAIEKERQEQIDYDYVEPSLAEREDRQKLRKKTAQERKAQLSVIHSGKPAQETKEEIAKVTPEKKAKETAPPREPKPSDITAYHGSPHKFSKFDLSKIGTGEGAQVYGHGIYLAEAEGVAKSYQEAIPHSKVKHAFLTALPEDANFEDVTELLGTGHFTSDQEAVIKALEADDWFGFDYPSQAISAAYSNKINDFDPSDELKSAIKDTSNLYEVELPNSAIAMMLDSDVPLNEQSESVQKAISSIVRDTNASKDMTGSDFYEYVIEEGTSAEALSKELSELGIPGIKYYDAQSRDATTTYHVQGGEQPRAFNSKQDAIDHAKKYGGEFWETERTRNFVIFDLDIVTIRKRNDFELTPQETREWEANEQKSKQEAADAIARDRKAVTPADAVRNIDETGCPK